MLRFGWAPPTQTGLTFRERLRLGMLVLALGVVVVAMRQIRQPATVEKLDRLFQELVPTGELLLVARSEAFETHIDVSAIEDNTYFRPEEQQAWFEMFARLQKTDAAELAAASVGELTYAQLLQQPNVYRGQVVTIRGTVLRAEEQQPADDAQGIARYHRLWLRPRGGGQWPFVVYSLTLPEEFPRGDRLRADASVTGLYFKNWSYSYDDGLGLAPIVLAKSIDWRRPAVTAPRQPVTLQGVVWVATGAALFALVTVWSAVRKSVRRPRRDARLPETLLPPVDWAAKTRNGEQS